MELLRCGCYNAYLKAVLGTVWMVLKALLPKLTNRPGTVLMVLKAEFAATGTPWTTRTACPGTAAAKSTVLSTASGSRLMVLTVKSLAVLTVPGMIRNPWTAVSLTESRAEGTDWTNLK